MVVYKKSVNGKIVPMTEEEIAEVQKMAEEAKNVVIPPTETERLEAIESALLELAEVMCNG